MASSSSPPSRPCRSASTPPRCWTKRSADPAYGADFKAKVVANTVSQEDNVRQVVSKVQLGEADAAVVYSTDATPQVRDQLQIIQVPDPLQTLATYPIAVAKGDNAAGGEAFVAYVRGAAGPGNAGEMGLPAADGDQPQPRRRPRQARLAVHRRPRLVPRRPRRQFQRLPRARFRHPSS